MLSEELIDVIDSNGFTVSEEYNELECWTKTGGNVLISCLNYENDYEFVRSLSKYYQDWNPIDEAMLYKDVAGTEGYPEMEVIINDYKNFEIDLMLLVNDSIDCLSSEQSKDFEKMNFRHTYLGKEFLSTYQENTKQLIKNEDYHVGDIFRDIVDLIPSQDLKYYLSDVQKKELYSQIHLEKSEEILRNAGYLDVSEWVYDFSEDEKKFFNSLPAIDKENFIKEVIEEFDAGRMQSSFYLSDSDVINEINPITEKILNEYKAKQALNNSKKEVKRESLKDRTVVDSSIFNDIHHYGGLDDLETNPELYTDEMLKIFLTLATNEKCTIDQLLDVCSIEASSLLYNHLVEWWGNEDSMETYIRSGYYHFFDNPLKDSELFFVTGYGYDVISSDLLGCAANGVAQEVFIHFCNEDDEVRRCGGLEYIENKGFLEEIKPRTLEEALGIKRSYIKELTEDKESLKSRTAHAKEVSKKDIKTVPDKKIEKER